MDAGAKPKRLFTAESANRALPYVRSIVDDVAESLARLDAAGREQARIWRGEDPALQGADRDRALNEASRGRDAARAALVRLAAELDQAGVLLKDPRRGLVDFPARVDGQAAFLCWRRGERAVEWWHDEASGFGGRRPLPPPEPPRGDGPEEGGEDPPPTAPERDPAVPVAGRRRTR